VTAVKTATRGNVKALLAPKRLETKTESKPKATDKRSLLADSPRGAFNPNWISLTRPPLWTTILRESVMAAVKSAPAAASENLKSADQSQRTGME
jgi:hypothetical protein